VSETIETDLLVIGAGSGGLSVAAGAAQMGARVVLIEKGEMGGDCLNYGCVPSKALLAAAKAAHAPAAMGRFGIEVTGAKVNFPKVHEHVRGVIAAIAPHDSQERFEGFGVHVIRAEARFEGRREVAAGGQHIRARRIVVATGSTPNLPPIPGLEDVAYLTNETVFDLTELPEHLAIVGAGPIGMEMAQAFRRLGSRVTVLEKFRALPKDDSDLARALLDSLCSEGIELREGVDIEQVAQSGTGVRISTTREGKRETVEASHLLIAAGRKPAVEGLNLEAAGVACAAAGISTDRRLRSTNKRIFAIGDCRQGPQFTHIAGYEAGIVIRNAMFKLPAKADYRAMPWVTYTDPELAQVGLTEQDARDRYGEEITVLREEYAHNDRAQTERATDGCIKLMVRKGRPVGATILGAQAGELINMWSLAIAGNMKLSSIAGYISPYPTLSELNKRVAGMAFTDALFSDRTRRLVRFIQRLG